MECDCSDCKGKRDRLTRLERQLRAADVIIGKHGSPKMCSQCKWEDRDFFCSILSVPSANDKRVDRCPYNVFEGKE